MKGFVLGCGVWVRLWHPRLPVDGSTFCVDKRYQKRFKRFLKNLLDALRLLVENNPTSSHKNIGGYFYGCFLVVF